VSSMQTHRISWNGISFEVPATWDLASYGVFKRTTRMHLEDDYSDRLEVEFVRLKHRPEIDAVRKRYDRAAKNLVKNAGEAREVEGLPQGWNAFVYSFSDERKLAIAFVRLPQSSLFAFFKIHFSRDDDEPPRQVVRTLTESFVSCEKGLIPWQVYDVDLEIPAEFTLISTTFQAGRKMFVFQQRMRRLIIWQVSLADLALRTQNQAEWATTLLNSCKLLRGPKFVAVDNEVRTRRSKGHPLGHYDEIGRWCFSYSFRIEHDQSQNRLYLWVLNHRNRADLAMLRGRVGPYPLNISQ